MKLSSFRRRTLFVALFLAPVAKIFSAPSDEYWLSVGIVDSQGPIRSVAHSGQDLFIGARGLSEVGGVIVTNVAKWDGLNWSALGEGLNQEETLTFWDLAVHHHSLFAAGTFNRSGSTFVTNFAKWDGEVWSQIGPGIGVRSLISNGSALFAGGNFEIPGEVPALNIAQWNGKEWLPLGSGISRPDEEWGRDDGTVWSLAVKDDDVYAGGRFDIAGGLPAKNVAKWDGEKWSALGSGLPEVRSLVIYQNELYAASNLLSGGQQNHIAKWNGTEWVQVGTGAYLGIVISSLATDGKFLYAGGQFSQIGGIPAFNIARWDGQNWSPLGSGVGVSGVQDLACSTSELFVAGGFPTAGGKPIGKLAVWQTPQTIKAEYLSDSLSLSWPEPDANFTLESANSLPSQNWQPVLGSPSLIRNRWTVTLPRPISTQFYRLRQQ